jgi:hypothetical protein
VLAREPALPALSHFSGTCCGECHNHVTQGADTPAKHLHQSSVLSPAAPHFPPDSCAIVSARTDTPLAMSWGLAYSSGRWLHPFLHGMKIMPVGAILHGWRKGAGWGGTQILGRGSACISYWYIPQSDPFSARSVTLSRISLWFWSHLPDHHSSHSIHTCCTWSHLPGHEE